MTEEGEETGTVGTVGTVGSLGKLRVLRTTGSLFRAPALSDPTHRAGQPSGWAKAWHPLKRTRPLQEKRPC